MVASQFAHTEWIQRRFKVHKVEILELQLQIMFLGFWIEFWNSLHSTSWLSFILLSCIRTCGSFIMQFQSSYKFSFFTMKFHVIIFNRNVGIGCQASLLSKLILEQISLCNKQTLQNWFYFDSAFPSTNTTACLWHNKRWRLCQQKVTSYVQPFGNPILWLQTTTQATHIISCLSQNIELHGSSAIKSVKGLCSTRLVKASACQDFPIS